MYQSNSCRTYLVNKVDEYEFLRVVKYILHEHICKKFSVKPKLQKRFFLLYLLSASCGNIQFRFPYIVNSESVTFICILDLQLCVMFSLIHYLVSLSFTE